MSAHILGVKDVVTVSADLVKPGEFREMAACGLCLGRRCVRWRRGPNVCQALVNELANDLNEDSNT